MIFKQHSLNSFTEISSLFDQQFNTRHFPETPEKLYDASQYLLDLGGKRIRPVCVLMGNQLFDDISEDGYHVANAVELFHNFSLVHDDIMDKAPLRRGMPTVHTKFGDSTALLAGDVMLVTAYDHLNKVKSTHLKSLVTLFNQTAREVCEGQQLDMDFEQLEHVNFDDYLNMITLKTSVLLASSLQMGAIIGGAGLGNQEHLYEFGKNLGIAFQIQDDYLDAFGDPAKFGKQVGGDILSNKKTFLAIHVMEVASPSQINELKDLNAGQSNDKLEKVLHIFKTCGVDEWANSLKAKYFDIAISHLEEVAVLSSRKQPLSDLAKFLVQRNH